ncbi:hypothetical protein E9229_003036 [Paeniglutamicibacter cryotolerans]|uniref:Uncharacterized protein n=1 Tax=Paeniglutamicibacter cryotolerans TaxID=670079 RepID=A0A839QKQ7_9MICC|nr:hypothetical protein [Paeniglutamicibacter cryotolerans]
MEKIITMLSGSTDAPMLPATIRASAKHAVGLAPIRLASTGANHTAKGTP